MHIAQRKNGFTVIEIIIVVVVLAIISGISFNSFVNLHNKEALDKDAHALESLLGQARSLTLSSKNAMQYGVHFETIKAVLFVGPTYDQNDPDNISFFLNSKNEISLIALGGGSEVLFDRLTGATENDGNITISLKANTSQAKVVKIFSSGLSEIE